MNDSPVDLDAPPPGVAIAGVLAIAGWAVLVLGVLAAFAQASVSTGSSDPYAAAMEGAAIIAGMTTLVTSLILALILHALAAVVRLLLRIDARQQIG